MSPLFSSMPLSRMRFRGALILGLSGFTLAACEVQQNATTVGPGGVTEIQVTSGLNRYDNKCFKYDPSNGTISVTGRRDVAPPPGVSLASGSITPSEFSATFQKGMMAQTLGQRND